MILARELLNNSDQLGRSGLSASRIKNVLKEVGFSQMHLTQFFFNLKNGIMKVKFIGASGTVTGSKTVVESN
jgi:hypothetical protein